MEANELFIKLKEINFQFLDELTKGFELGSLKKNSSVGVGESLEYMTSLYSMRASAALQNGSDGDVVRARFFNQFISAAKESSDTTCQIHTFVGENNTPIFTIFIGQPSGKVLWAVKMELGKINGVAV